MQKGVNMPRTHSPCPVGGALTSLWLPSACGDSCARWPAPPFADPTRSRDDRDDGPSPCAHALESTLAAAARRKCLGPNCPLARSLGRVSVSRPSALPAKQQQQSRRNGPQRPNRIDCLSIEGKWEGKSKAASFNAEANDKPQPSHRPNQTNKQTNKQLEGGTRSTKKISGR